MTENQDICPSGYEQQALFVAAGYPLGGYQTPKELGFLLKDGWMVVSTTPLWLTEAPNINKSFGSAASAVFVVLQRKVSIDLTDDIG